METKTERDLESERERGLFKTAAIYQMEFCVLKWELHSSRQIIHPFCSPTVCLLNAWMDLIDTWVDINPCPAEPSISYFSNSVYPDQLASEEAN